MYKVSKNFEMNISFEELISNNKTCKVNLNSTHHFESFEGLLIYVSHPQNKEKFTIELGVDVDGIVYEGDYGCIDSFKEIPIEEGLKLLEAYRVLLNARSELEYLLLNNKLEKDEVRVEIK